MIPGQLQLRFQLVLVSRRLDCDCELEGSTTQIAHPHGSCLGRRPGSCWLLGGLFPWLLVRGLGSSHGPLHKLPECPDNMVATFPKSEQSKRVSKEEATLPFMTSSLKLRTVTSTLFSPLGADHYVPPTPKRGQLGSTQVITMYLVLWSLCSP